MSRREALCALGGTVLAGCAAPTTDITTLAEEEKPAKPASIIDTHVHLVDARVPGGLENPVRLAPFAKGDKKGPEKLAQKVQAEMKKAGVAQALCMPRFEVSDTDPLGIQETLKIIKLIDGPKLHPIGLAHPERFDRDHLDRVDQDLKAGKVKALKAYLGYLHHEPFSPGYRFYFKLAAKYDVPVIFHTGDTYSRTAKLKFAHPLKIDEVAVDYPKTKFVIAHFGNPWLLDAAQVAYKNERVWVDVSAILIGSEKEFAAWKEDGVLERTAQRVKQAIEYTGNPKKFLFGSDWPLSSVATYRDWVGGLFPEKDHEAVFGGNAKELFRL
jgi:predicted TIM-barrel fold metal-dependent hydrolase